MRAVLGVVGVAGILLGGLWLLQGLGLVQVRPILCVADCETVQGPSLGWVLAGAAVALCGVLGVVRGFGGRRGRAARR